MQNDSIANIPLRDHHGRVRAYAIVDARDAKWAKRWRWSLDSDGYAQRSFQVDGIKTTVKLHRELLGLRSWSGLEGDHLNHDRLDNTRSNLRVVPVGVNQQNRSSRPGSSSRYRGVTWNKLERRWKACVRVEGRYVHCGYFTDELEAARAASDARLRLMPYAVEPA